MTNFADIESDEDRQNAKDTFNYCYRENINDCKNNQVARLELMHDIVKSYLEEPPLPHADNYIF